MTKVTKNIRPFAVQAGVNENVQIRDIAWRPIHFSETSKSDQATLTIRLSTYKEDTMNNGQLNKVQVDDFMTDEQLEELENDEIQKTNSVIPEFSDIAVLPLWIVSRTKNSNNEPYSADTYKRKYTRIQSMFVLYKAVLGKEFSTVLNTFQEESKFYTPSELREGIYNFDEKYYNEPAEMLEFYKSVGEFFEKTFNDNKSKFTSPRFNMLFPTNSSPMKNDVGETKWVSVQYAEFPEPKANKITSWFESYIEDKEQTLIKTDSNYYQSFYVNEYIKTKNGFIKNKRYANSTNDETDFSDNMVTGNVKASDKDDLPF